MIQSSLSKEFARKGLGASAKGILIFPEITKGGLMGGLGLQGSKITRIQPPR